MSSIGKIQKNAEKFKLEQIYNNMTPQMYQEGIKRAVREATKTLSQEYDLALEKTTNEYNEKLKMINEQANNRVKMAIDIISIELLYELGNQLECFKDDVEYLDQKIDVVQNIYQKTMDCVWSYLEAKNTKKSFKEFKNKENKVKEVFKIMR